MEMTGEYRIPADRETVWNALNDPETLKACIPGCEELTRNEDGSMSAKVVADVSPAKATFDVGMNFSNVVPPESCTIRVEGKGGVAGAAKGQMDVRLAKQGNATVLSYAAKAEVGGKLAQLGPVLIDTNAKRLADDFFAAFAASLGGEALLLTAPSIATPGEEAAEEELIDRLEHRVEEFADDVAEAAEEAEEELEVAAGRGFLGGPYVWGLLVLMVGVAILAVMR